MVNYVTFSFSVILTSVVLVYSVIYFASVKLYNTPTKNQIEYVERHSSPDSTLAGIESVTSPRLLFMTASYSFTQFHSLQKVLDCLRDICNGGWDVTVLLQTASGFNSSHSRYNEILDRAYCVRTQKHIPITVEHFGQIGFGLNSQHRAYMRSRLDDFDYFSFAEEDMQLTLSHLTAFVKAQEKLRDTLGDEGWLRYFIGFIRYEDSVVGTERVTWEYLPHQIHVVQLGPNHTSSSNNSAVSNKYVVTNNLNQAIFVLSREHIVHLEERCDFLTIPGRNLFYQALRKAQNQDWKYMSVGVSEWSSSFQQVLQCGMRRVVPVEHFQLYMIHHGTNIAQKRRLRKELLTYSLWMQLIANKSVAPMNVDYAYNRVVFDQYNLGLIDGEALRRSGTKWDWDHQQELTKN